MTSFKLSSFISAFVGLLLCTWVSRDTKGDNIQRTGERGLFAAVWAKSIWAASSISVTSDSCQRHNHISANQDTYVDAETVGRCKEFFFRAPEARVLEHFANTDLYLDREAARGEADLQQRALSPASSNSPSPRQQPLRGTRLLISHQSVSTSIRENWPHSTPSRL